MAMSCSSVAPDSRQSSLPMRRRGRVPFSKPLLLPNAGVFGSGRIGDSVVVIEAGELSAEVKPWRGFVYVYVEDVDTVFARAIELGAKVLAPVEAKPYQERQGGFLDAAGNTWRVATYKGE